MGSLYYWHLREGLSTKQVGNHRSTKSSILPILVDSSFPIMCRLFLGNLASKSSFLAEMILSTFSMLRSCSLLFETLSFTADILCSASFMQPLCFSNYCVIECILVHIASILDSMDMRLCCIMWSSDFMSVALVESSRGVFRVSLVSAPPGVRVEQWASNCSLVCLPPVFPMLLQSVHLRIFHWGNL